VASQAHGPQAVCTGAGDRGGGKYRKGAKVAGLFLPFITADIPGGPGAGLREDFRDPQAEARNYLRSPPAEAGDPVAAQ